MDNLLIRLAMSLPEDSPLIPVIHRLYHDREMTAQFGKNWRELDLDELAEMSKK